MRPYAGGTKDAFWAVFDANDSLVLTSYQGGSASDEAYAIDIRDGKVAIVGDVHSNDLWLVDGGGNAYDQTAPAGAMLIELNEAGVVQHCTYFGGTGAYFFANSYACVKIEDDGDIIFTGNTFSQDLPLFQSGLWYHADPELSYVAEFDGQTRARKWVTYVGNSGNGGFSTRCLELDDQDNIYIGGATSLKCLPIQEIANMYFDSIPSGDCIANPNSGQDAGLLIFSQDNWLSYGSYLGGNEIGVTPDEQINSLAWFGDVIYATCETGAHLPDPACKPYLWDPGSGAYYQDTVFTFDVNASTGLLVALCTEGVTAVEETATQQGVVSAYVDSSGDLVLTASGEEVRHVVMYDAIGKVVVNARPRTDGVGRYRSPLPMLAAGVYALTVHTEGTLAATKLFIAR